ncbi:hypothetical protein WJX72_007982 [[Myrmecia] bisecta]|uniref:Prolyl 4-hydroxylase alpha subunit domain-containing protein n=1 Tax=[Myrmecia] bisecta TaxID=41462 RepID=A0AAW1P690_9CHLO
MHPNSTHLVREGSTQLLEKAGIYEAEMMQQDMQQAAPLCAALQHDTTLRTMLSLFMPQLRLDSQAIKLQVNQGNGACFPLHYDSDEQLDGRKVTAIMYLNPDWEPSHGGQLRLYPFPGPPVDVAPVNDRLLLFSACRMLHRVMPSAVERVCFTTWLSQARRPAGIAAASPISLSQLVQGADPAGDNRKLAQRLLGHPEARRYVAKACYQEAWADSIAESHPDTAARAEALRTFWQDVWLIRRALSGLSPDLDLLLQGKLPESAVSPFDQWF